MSLTRGTIQGGGSGRIGFFHREVSDLEAEDFSQTLQLFDGGDVVVVFDPSDHDPVDTGDGCKLGLGEVLGFAEVGDGFFCDSFSWVNCSLRKNLYHTSENDSYK